MNETIFVTGHRHPDSDSICAAITYANLLKLQGKQAAACRQGPLNDETKFILRRFHQENPLLLTDARTMLRDIDLDQPALISYRSQVHHAWHIMLHMQTRSLFVVDDNDRLIGVVTTTNLSSYRLQEDKDLWKLMATADAEAIAHTIGGKVIWRPADFHTNGVAHVISLEGHEIHQSDMDGGIAILSGPAHAQQLVLDKGVRCLILTCGIHVTEEILEAAKKIACAVIETPENTMHTAMVINESYAVKEIMDHDVSSFREDEYINDAAKKMGTERFRTYPVLNEEGVIIGAVSRYHTLNYARRKLVLVDHSAINQSINHLEDADIVAIIDHHHIGDITTDHPIEYRNRVCGCTCTIIAGLYKEEGFTPDPDMAGLMLSAILSDTLNLKSGTTTEMDIRTVHELAEIAGIEDIDAYAAEMLGASVSLKNSSPKDILYRDLKDYEIGKYHIAIGQTNYARMAEVTAILPEFRRYLEKEQADRNLDLLVMLFTDVMGNGSVFLHYGPLSRLISENIENNFSEHYGFDANIISRKQQLIPLLSAAIKKL